MKCGICGVAVTNLNDGMALVQQLLSFEEHQRFEAYKKPLCIECKREMLFANILAVV